VAPDCIASRQLFRPCFLNVTGKGKFIVYRDRATGRLSWTSDFRNMSYPSDSKGDADSDGLEILKKWFWVRPDRPFPMAAYAVPGGLMSGSRVYLKDLIEEVLREVWNQRNSRRLDASCATWDGTSFVVDADLSMGIQG
jgi:hypothetical protein